MAICGMGNCGLLTELAAASSCCHQGFGHLGCSLEWALLSKGRSWGRAGAICAERGLRDPGRDCPFTGYLVFSPRVAGAGGVGTSFQLCCLWSGSGPTAVLQLKEACPLGPAAWTGSLMLTQGGLSRRHLGEDQGESKGGCWVPYV